jgi:hypothetical protein
MEKGRLIRAPGKLLIMFYIQNIDGGDLFRLIRIFILRRRIFLPRPNILGILCMEICSVASIRVLYCIGRIPLGPELCRPREHIE